jgi:hypothetical protein
LFNILLRTGIAMAAVGATWAFGLPVFERGSEEADYRIRMSNFDDWPALYAELGGDENYAVPLSYIKGLSGSYTEANGDAAVNFKTGEVSVRVRGLAPLEDGLKYEVLLVDKWTIGKAHGTASPWTPDPAETTWSAWGFSTSMGLSRPWRKRWTCSASRGSRWTWS